ncbi:MAG: response regulator/pilus assembly protein [Firmicutes bacterium]|nr:response regulator/pilus assembly protein [Bacillota bacterium]
MTADSIRVMIVDDTKETRSNIKKLLEFEDGIIVVGEAADGAEAVLLAQELKPDCILMDINMPGLDGISATEQIYKVIPDCMTIVISVQGEQEYLRRAMAAGARDYLIKPFSGDELISTIQWVWQLECARRSHNSAESTPLRSGRVIVVFSAKGGVGKSTIAVNLASSLVKQEQKVILVDLDLQFGDVPLMLNLPVKHSMADWYTDGCGSTGDYLLNHSSGLQVLAAPEVPEDGELITAEHISQMLNDLKPLADYIVVDTPQFFHETTLQSLEEADQIILAAVPDLSNLKNVHRCLNVLEKLNLADKVKIAANKVGSEGIKLDQFSSHLQHPIWQSLPYDPRLTAQAAVQGIPVIDLNPKAKLSRALVHASEVLAGTEIKPGKKGLPLASLLFARKG